MRIVVALGGNALARRGEPATAERLRGNVRASCATLAELVSGNEVVITHAVSYTHLTLPTILRV